MSSRIRLNDAFLQTLPAPFLAWYHQHLTGNRAIYLHWSGGLYGRTVGTHHKQVSVPTPVALDESIQRYADARQRRIGGAYQALFHTVESYKTQAVLQTFTNAPYDQDLAGHTRGRDTHAISLALMCGLGHRPNDVGYAPPLPLQLKALSRLVAEACQSVSSPVTACLTAAEAADNLDYESSDDAAAPHPPFGFGSTRECLELALWIDPSTLEVFAPLQSARPGWQALGDWVREQAMLELCRMTRTLWDAADTQPSAEPPRGPQASADTPS